MSGTLYEVFKSPNHEIMDALNYAALKNTMRRTSEMNRVRMPSLKRGVRRTRKEISAPKRTTC